MTTVVGAKRAFASKSEIDVFSLDRPLVTSQSKRTEQLSPIVALITGDRDGLHVTLVAGARNHARECWQPAHAAWPGPPLAPE
jgi:hypothetical protein